MLTQQQMQNPSAGLPEIIRVQALKGFRGNIDGAFGVASPGDVVDVPRDLAVTLRFGNKAIMVDPRKEKVRQANYLPKRKTEPPTDPQARQIAALTDAVNSMRSAVEAQGEALKAVLGAKK